MTDNSVLHIVEKDSSQRKPIFNVFTIKSHNVGDQVVIFDRFGNQVGSGQITKDFSEDPRYQNAKKRIGNVDVMFNSGMRYYQIERRKK